MDSSIPLSLFHPKDKIPNSENDAHPEKDDTKAAILVEDKDENYSEEHSILKGSAGPQEVTVSKSSISQTKNKDLTYESTHNDDNKSLSSEIHAVDSDQSNQLKYHSNINKRDPFIIDNNNNSKKLLLKNLLGTMSQASAYNLHQSIVEIGATVSPVSVKTSPIRSDTQNVLPILPSLTDDMFIFAAPSFVVPYVYEKLSAKPFREFVDALGRELEEQKLKGELEIKVKEEDEKKYTDSLEQEDKEYKDTTESDDMSDGGKTEMIKDRGIQDPIPTTDIKTVSVKTDNNFDNTLGKFFISAGLNLVQEFVQTDLLKQHKRKLHKNNRSGATRNETKSAISQLKKDIECTKENNAPYKFEQKKCECCSFESESLLVMAHHMEVPHMKKKLYKCNFCSFKIRRPGGMLYHMDAEHNMKGRLERAPANHRCANCPFEDNVKAKLARHLKACAKQFKPEINLAPPVDWEPPAKIPQISRARNNMMSSSQAAFNSSALYTPCLSRPMMNPAAASATASVVRGGRMPTPPTRPPVLTDAPMVRSGLTVRHNSPVGGNYPGPISRARNNMMSSSKAAFNSSALYTPCLSRPMMNPAAASATASVVRGGRMPTPPTRPPVLTDAPMVRSGLTVRHNSPVGGN